MITDKELARLEALAAAATPGPWDAVRRDDDDDGSIARLIWSARGEVACLDDDARPDRRATLLINDSNFIAAAREAVPALIAEVRWLSNLYLDANLRLVRLIPNRSCHICDTLWRHDEGKRWTENCPKCFESMADDRFSDIRTAIFRNGCDCSCGHGDEEHGDECDRCLACVIGAIVEGKCPGHDERAAMADRQCEVVELRERIATLEESRGAVSRIVKEEHAAQVAGRPGHLTVWSLLYTLKDALGEP